MHYIEPLPDGGADEPENVACVCLVTIEKRTTGRTQLSSGRHFKRKK